MGELIGYTNETGVDIACTVEDCGCMITEGETFYTDGDAAVLCSDCYDTYLTLKV